MIEEETLQHHKKKGIILLLLSIIVIIALFFLLDQFEILNVRESLQAIPLPYILLSTGAMSLAFLGMGFRWRALMPCKPQVLPLSAIVCAGLLLNYAAPGPMGEFAAAYFASKRFPLSFSKALACGVIARLLGLLSASILGFLVWLIVPLDIPDDLEFTIQLTAIFSLILACGLLSLILFAQTWISIAQRFHSKTNPTSLIQKIRNKITSAISTLCSDIAHISVDPKASYTKALFWSIFSHTCVITGILLLAYGLSPSFWGIVFTYSVTTAGAVLLFALPGSYLGWDALFFALLLATGKIDQNHAIAIVGIVRIQQLSYMLLGGMSLHHLLKNHVNKES